jgi:hypothetical protein
MDNSQLGMCSLLKTQVEKSVSEEPNSRVLFGLAETRIGDLDGYVTDFLKELFTGGKNKIKFNSIELCSPFDTLQSTPKASRSKFEISVSDISLYRLKFSYNGEAIGNKHVYLPFCTQGGLLRLSDSVYALNSVLSDKSISPNKNGVFIRLFKGKISVRKITYEIRINKELMMQPFLSANIYKTKKLGLSTASVDATGVIIYLLTKYGYSRTMKDLLGFVPELSYDPVYNDDVVIYESAAKPNNKYNKLRIQSDVKFIVPAKHVNTNVVGFARANYINLVMCNMVSTVDHFYGDDVTIADFDDTDVWAALLGSVIFPGTMPSEYINSVGVHLSSLDGYIDGFMQKELEIEFEDTLNEDFSKDGFYRLLSVIMKNYLEWSAAANEITGTVEDKRYRLLYFLLSNILQMFNTIAFRVEQLRDEQNTLMQVSKLMDEGIRKKTIYNIRRNNQACTIVNYSGDHGHFKFSSNATLQASIDTNGGAKNGVANPTTLLHESQSVAGTHNAISMTRLSCLPQMNLFVTLKNGTTKIIISKDRRKDLAILSKILKSSSKRSSNPAIPKAFRVV